MGAPGRSFFSSAAFFACYGALLLLLLEVKPLWLDEILQLTGTQRMTPGDAIWWAATSPGGVPLPLLGQAIVFQLLGYSVFSARLLSAVCGIGSAIGVWRIGRMIGLRQSLTAAAVFALLPLQFRYAMEARPYAVGMLWSVWSTVALLWMLRELNWRRATVYGVLVALGIYSHPYSVFVAFGHLGWALWCQGRGPYLRSLLYTMGAVGSALLLYGAWFWWTEPLQRQAVPLGHSFAGVGQALRLLARELSGAGTVGTGLLILGPILGLRSRRLTTEAKVFFACGVLTPIAGALVMDAVYGHLFAVRQVIFALPGVVLAAVAGSGRWWSVAMLTVAILGDVSLLLRPSENWQVATETLLQVAPANGCVIVVPMQQAQLYEFFAPQIRERLCGSGKPAVQKLALVVTPYTRWGELEGVVERILACAFYKTGETAAGGTRILMFARDRAGEGFCMSQRSETFGIARSVIMKMLLPAGNGKRSVAVGDLEREVTVFRRRKAARSFPQRTISPLQQIEIAGLG